MKNTSKSTLMMEQYLSIKARHNDAILFFRMGDVYEMFYDDAQVASEVLGIISLYMKKDRCGLAGIDVSTGEFFVVEATKQSINEQVQIKKLTFFLI